MTMQTKREQSGFEMTLLPPLESLIPADHHLRRLDRVLDLSFVHEAVRDRYCQDNGRPSIDPEVVLRLFLLQALEGITHVRKLMRQVSVADPVIDPDLLPLGSRGRGDPEGQVESRDQRVYARYPTHERRKYPAGEPVTLTTIMHTGLLDTQPPHTAENLTLRQRTVPHHQTMTCIVANLLMTINVFCHLSLDR